MTTAGLCGLVIAGMELNTGREQLQPDGTAVGKQKASRLCRLMAECSGESSTEMKGQCPARATEMADDDGSSDQAKVPAAKERGANAGTRTSRPPRPPHPPLPRRRGRHRRGTARRTGLDRRTVRKYIALRAPRTAKV